MDIHALLSDCSAVSLKALVRPRSLARNGRGFRVLDFHPMRRKAQAGSRLLSVNSEARAHGRLRRGRKITSSIQELSRTDVICKFLQRAVDRTPREPAMPVPALGRHSSSNIFLDTLEVCRTSNRQDLSHRSFARHCQRDYRERRLGTKFAQAHWPVEAKQFLPLPHMTDIDITLRCAEPRGRP
jgi:hypothetical protein